MAWRGVASRRVTSRGVACSTAVRCVSVPCDALSDHSPCLLYFPLSHHLISLSPLTLSSAHPTHPPSRLRRELHPVRVRPRLAARHDRGGGHGRHQEVHPRAAHALPHLAAELRHQDCGSDRHTGRQAVSRVITQMAVMRWRCVQYMQRNVVCVVVVAFTNT